MSITYSPELDPFVQAEIATGPYRSPDELVTAALRVYRELKTRHARLRKEVQEAIAEADAGKAIPLDAEGLKERVAKRLAAEGITE